MAFDMADFTEDELDELRERLSGVYAPVREPSLPPMNFNTAYQKPDKPEVTSARATNPNPAPVSPSSPVPATPPLSAAQRAVDAMPIPGLPGNVNYGALQSYIAQTPEIVSQQQLLEPQKQLLQGELGVPQQADLSGIMSFADYLAKGQGTLSRGYKAPEDRTQLRAALMKQIQAGQSDINEAQRKRLQDLLKFGGTKAASSAENRQQQRIDNQVHQQTLRALRNDKPLRDRLGQFQNLDNALALITKPGEITPPQLHEFQQAIRKNIGISGTSGVGEREKTYFNSLGLNAASFEQFLTGKPVDVSNNKELMHHLKELAQIEKQNISDQMLARIDAVTEGNYENVYKRRKDLERDLKRAIKAAGNQFKAAPIEAGSSGPSEEEKKILKQELDKNPNGPDAAAIKQLLGIK